MDSETRPALATYEDFARLIDHSLLKPQLTAADVIADRGTAARDRTCPCAS